MATIANFDQAFTFVVGIEGTYDNSSADRGNWTSGIIGQGELKGTKYGISAMSYPNLDIKNLTLDQAKSIYYRDFWLVANCNLLAMSIAIAVFDSAVNQSPDKAIKFLQTAINAVPDGNFGPKSLAALTVAMARLGEGGTLMAFLGARQQAYTEDSEWPLYGKGWIRRTTAYIAQWKNGY